jgi:D-glycero-alpha-D-manno-heptose 1-phosphate guanylyltransferase
VIATGERMTMRMADVDAVILAGGLGTRLRAVVADRPKVMAVINGRPFLNYLFDQLITAGIARVVLCTGYLSRQIQSCVGDSYRTLSIVHSVESVPLGTAGALRLASQMLLSNPALVMNGDSYCAVSLERFWLSHLSAKAAATLVLARLSNTERYGRVKLGAGDEVIGFEEKGGTQGQGLINAGIYLIHRSLIDEIPIDRAVSLEREVFPKWIGRSFYGFETDGKFLDIGTPESYASAPAFFAGGSMMT